MTVYTLLVENNETFYEGTNRAEALEIMTEIIDANFFVVLYCETDEKYSKLHSNKEFRTFDEWKSKLRDLMTEESLK